MKRQRLSLLHALALSLLFSVSLPLPGQQQVTATLKALPESYTGECPALFTFQGAITSSAPGVVRYRFLRSDNAFAPVQSLYFAKPGTQSVSTTWELGSLGTLAAQRWQAIEILSPLHTTSNRALFTLQCQAGPPTPALETFRFVVLGDSQEEDRPWSGVHDEVFVPILKEVERRNPAFIVFLGDMSLDSNLKSWNHWKALVRRFTARGIRVYNVIGNHELGDSDDPEIGWQRNYQRAFSHLPRNGPPGYEHLAYSFEYKNSIFFILDSFYVYPNGHSMKERVSAPQLAWLNGLARVRPKTHRFAFTHSPALPITGGSGDQGLWSALVLNRFDALFSGHVHLYARSQGPSQPLQIISGGAGGKISEDIEKRPPTLYQGHHFVVVDVVGNRVTVTMIRVLREDGPNRVQTRDIYSFVKN